MFTAFGFGFFFFFFLPLAVACFEIHECKHPINAYQRVSQLLCVWTKISLQHVFQKAARLGIQNAKGKEFTHVLGTYASDSPPAPLQGFFYFNFSGSLGLWPTENKNILETMTCTNND